MIFNRQVLSCMGMLLLAGLSHGQESSTNTDDLALLYGDEESVSIATGSSKPIHLVPSVASVITAADIEAMGATDLDQVLERVPGLHVSQSFSRLDSIYSIRGIHTGQNPQTLMLVNGIPITQLFSGGRPGTLHLPVASISRVEVIRGPGSAIYGADAFSGVINVITKKAEDISGTLFGLRTGSFNTRDLWLQHGGKLGGWDISFNLELGKSDGDRDRVINSDLQTGLDGIFGTSASLAPGPLDTRYDIVNTRLDLARDNWNIGMWSWMQDDGGIGPGAAQALDPAGGQDIDQYLLDVSYRNEDPTRDWAIETRFSYLYADQQVRFNVFPPGAVLPIGTDGNVNFASPTGFVAFPDGLVGNPGGIDHSTGLEATVVYSGIDRHLVRLNTGFKYQKLVTNESKNFGPGIIDGSVSPVSGTLTDVTGTSFIYMEDQDRQIWHVSLQDEWAVGRDWELTAGIRYDHYSDFGNTINPRLALVWATRHNLTTKLLYGTAFRAPSFSEQFAINNPSILGNPNLEPEIIDTLELAFDYRPNYRLHTVFSLFSYKIDDLIEFVPDPVPASTNTARNSKNQHGYGFELEANWKLNETFYLNGSYAWQRSEDKNSGETIADAPGQQFYLDANWKFTPAWSLNSQLNWVGDRKRIQGDTRSQIDDYTQVNLTIRHKHITKDWEIAASIHNLFDEDAREPSNGAIPDDYPLQGRSVFLEVRYKLGG